MTSKLETGLIHDLLKPSADHFLSQFYKTRLTNWLFGLKPRNPRC